MDDKFIKAYQAYQQRNYEQCLKFLQDIKHSSCEIKDLMAQAYFQKKEYQKAYDVYTDLILKGGELTKERKENLITLVTCAQLIKPGLLKTKDKLPTQEEIVAQVERIDLKDDSVYDLFSKPEPSNKRKKQRKRKKRLPKQYDPVAGPDPERWLPRRDRKKGQKKRRPRPKNVRGKK